MGLGVLEVRGFHIHVDLLCKNVRTGFDAWSSLAHAGAAAPPRPRALILASSNLPRIAIRNYMRFETIQCARPEAGRSEAGPSKGCQRRNDHCRRRRRTSRLLSILMLPSTYSNVATCCNHSTKHLTLPAGGPYNLLVVYAERLSVSTYCYRVGL